MNLQSKKNIENLEYEILIKVAEIAEQIVPEISNSLNKSKKYMQHLAIPLIIASVEEKTYNPFAGVIENISEFLFIQEAKKHRWVFLPLGFSSDLCFESDKAIIHIDIKTANIDNPSDFKNTAPLSLNQFSYPGILPLGKEGSYYKRDGVNSIKVFPNLPSFYKDDSNVKVTVTLSLQFIYPSYKKQVDSIRNAYKNVLKIIQNKLPKLLEKEGIPQNLIRDILEYMPKKARKKRKEIYSENLFRGIYIHNRKPQIMDLLELDQTEKKAFEEFEAKLSNFIDDLKIIDITPIAFRILVLPNGCLVPDYDKEVVSGKNHGRSIRHHYGFGTFKQIGNKNRLYEKILDNKYKKQLESLLTLNELNQKLNI